ncbi:MAG: glycogen debranching enzyme, partial [Thermodesulfovibrionales bacterium]
MNPESRCGKSFPLGSTICEGGVNFSVYSRNSVGLDLLLFDTAEDASPSAVIRLDPRGNRTFHYWHIFIPGLKVGQIYGYRAHGPREPWRGLRFDPDKVLLDPYAKAICVPERYSRKAARLPGGDASHAMKSVVVDFRGYDWEGDTQLKRPFAETVIYEMHVAGFTRHPNSGVPP